MFINRWMNKQINIMVYLDSSILVSNQKEDTSVMWNNMMSCTSYKWIIQYVFWLILINIMIFTSMLGLLELVCNSSQQLTVYILSQLYIQWCHIGSSKLVMVGIFLWWKLANGHKSEQVENPPKLIFYFNLF